MNISVLLFYIAQAKRDNIHQYMCNTPLTVWQHFGKSPKIVYKEKSLL